jgi:hypothetical protein
MHWMNTVAAIALLAVATSGCGNGPVAPSGSGTLNLRITDGPFSDAKAVLVTFSEVTAHRAGGEGEGGWSTVPFAETATSRTCDLKKLESGAQDLLGVGTLPAGHYTMLRLMVSSATLYFDNTSDGAACAPSISEPAGARFPVDLPSGEVKLNRQFTVPEAGATTILIDFDGDRSISRMGNGTYRMAPVVGIVSVQ